jgi:hypothetical protein
LLTHHQTVHTLACGRKSQPFDFGKKPESITAFSFARSLADDWKRSGDPAAAPLLQHLYASLDFGKSPGNRQKAWDAEPAIARMEPHLRQTVKSMLSKDAFLDGYLHYWNALVLEGEGKAEEAVREFAEAGAVSYGVPHEQLRNRMPSPAPRPMRQGKARAELFAAHIDAGDTLLQVGSGDGSLLRELPGLLKLGLETDDALRKQASLASGIDSFNGVGELPDGFADIVIGDFSLARFPDPLSLLKSLRGKLKAGGKAVFTTQAPDADPAQGGDGELFSWTAASMANIFRAAGFRIGESKIVDVPGAGRCLKILADRLPGGDPQPAGRDWVQVKDSGAGAIARPLR